MVAHVPNILSAMSSPFSNAVHKPHENIVIVPDGDGCKNGATSIAVLQCESARLPAFSVLLDLVLAYQFAQPWPGLMRHLIVIVQGNV